MREKWREKRRWFMITGDYDLKIEKRSDDEVKGRKICTEVFLKWWRVQMFEPPCVRGRGRSRSCRRGCRQRRWWEVSHARLTHVVQRARYGAKLQLPDSLLQVGTLSLACNPFPSRHQAEDDDDQQADVGEGGQVNIQERCWVVLQDVDFSILCLHWPHSCRFTHVEMSKMSEKKEKKK